MENIDIPAADRPVKDISKIEKGMTKAVFFDRDGTLNVDVDYLHRIEDFHWVEGAVEAIECCKAKGYLVIVITNQSGVARGFYPESDIPVLHDWMNRELNRLTQGRAHIDGFYYCPHHPQAKIKKYAVDCDCRKPKPGMLKQALAEFNIAPAKSYMVGDAVRDVECGEAAGVRGLLYKGGSLYELVRDNIQ